VGGHGRTAPKPHPGRGRQPSLPREFFLLNQAWRLSFVAYTDGASSSSSAASRRCVDDQMESTHRSISAVGTLDPTAKNPHEISEN
jgi:hypothetical protein